MVEWKSMVKEGVVMKARSIVFDQNSISGGNEKDAGALMVYGALDSRKE